MNEDRIQRLGRRARLETPPRPDIADRVMATIRREQVVDIRPLAWVAGAVALAAVPVTMVAVVVWQQWAHPLMSIFVEPTWGLLP